jgi:hypothetical protein
MRKRVLAVLTTAALAASAAVATVAEAGPSAASPLVDRVTGHTYVLLGPSVFGDTVQQSPLAYAASKRANGDVSGHWRYDYYEAGVETTFSGSVTCLAVQGNRAWVGGPITASSDPTQVGSGAWWQVADNGTGAHPVVPDRTTFVGIGTLDQTQTYCDTAPDPHFIFDVQRGGLKVISR